tara:strand:- start:105 stop:536 length:432 start_codon:yes stop_codon:yes gene_type:complete
MPVKTDIVDNGAYIAHLEETVQRLSQELEQADLLGAYLEHELQVALEDEDLADDRAEKLLHRLESSQADLSRAEAQIYMYGEHVSALESLLKKEEKKNKDLNEEVDNLLVNIRCSDESIDLDSFVFGLLAGVCLFGAVALFMV